jgi:hypothetical protein
MELNIFNKANCRQHVTEPAVRITTGGAIVLNKKALDIMELVENNSISIALDKQRPKDWYIFRDADGMPIKKKSGTTESLGIASSFICNEIKTSLGVDKKKSLSILLAPAPTVENGKTLWALITSKVKAQ